MGPVAATTGTYDVALNRRKALMGDSGPMALVQNFRVFGIACFACIGGLLYGYNQGVFSGVLTMNNFMDRKDRIYPWSTRISLTCCRYGRLRLQTRSRPNSQRMAHLYFGTRRLGWNTAVRLLGWAVLEEDQHHHRYRRLHHWCCCTDHRCRRWALVHPWRQIHHVSIMLISWSPHPLTMPLAVWGSALCPWLSQCTTPSVLLLKSGVLSSRSSNSPLRSVSWSASGLISTLVHAHLSLSLSWHWLPSGTNYIGGTGSTQSEASWLVPICLQLAPALALFCGMIFMPYSPRWLVHHDREVEARKVLATLRGLSQDHELVELEFLEIKAQSTFEKRTVADKFPHLQHPGAWNTFKLQFVAIGSLFKSMAMFRRVIVATVTM